MALTDQSALHVVLFEGDGAEPLPATDRFAAVSALLEKGYAVSSTSRSQVEKPDRGPLLVLGRFASEPASTQASQAGVDIEVVPDLCKMSAESDPALHRIAASGHTREHAGQFVLQLSLFCTWMWLSPSTPYTPNRQKLRHCMQFVQRS